MNDAINILVNAPLFESFVPRIRAVDSRLAVTFIGDLLKAERTGDSEAGRTLDGLLASAEVYAGMRLPERLLQRAPRLKWIQLTSAGVDHALDDELRHSPILLTNAVNLHSFAVAEFALTACLTLAKNVREYYRQKESGEWQPMDPVLMRGKTMGIIGFGHVGRRVARAAKALEMRVIGMRRSERAPERARYADLVLPGNGLDQLLTESDFVVLTLPLTSSTHHLIGARELGRMKSSAFLVNVSRGPIVDEAALATALASRTIAGAAVDVYAVEPLPADSPLRGMPNLFFSPHVGGWIREYPSMVIEVFIDNIGRYLKGDRLRNLVDKRRGY